MPRRQYDPAEDPELARLILAAQGKARERANLCRESKENQYRAWYFFYLYNQDHGVFGNRKGNPYRMSRRVWIERMVRIVDKKTRTIPLKLNRSQRLLEARVLRAERHGRPVRIVILKVRQNGISSYIIAYWLWAVLTRQNVKAQIITHQEKLYTELLWRLRVMYQKLAMQDGQPWDIPAEGLSRNLIAFGEPYNSAVAVVTAGADDPGFGQTPTLLDMEETSKWPKAHDKIKGILPGIPDESGTVIFDVSQPKGNSGYFADKFKSAEKRKLQLADLGEGADLSLGWDPLFIPWYFHDEDYRYTRLGGNSSELPKAIEERIKASLDDEEEILLKQQYFVRGKGWRFVDYDQLAWRRYYIDKLNGSLEAFHEQCPAFPDEAFLSSGRPFFISKHVRAAMANHERAPQAIGDIYAGPAFSETKHGRLWIWKMPDKARTYSMGVDTSSGIKGLESAGPQGGDPCVAVVLDTVTQEIVAEWYGWEPPPAFGVTVAALSAFYGAIVAIETHPSAHGLAVFHVAEQAGCERLYVQQVPDKLSGKFQTRKGWIMTSQAKYDVMHRVSKALIDGTPICSPRLLQELLDARVNDKDLLDDECRNDLIMAYGIALQLADKNRVRQVQEPEPEKLPPVDSEEYFHMMRKRAKARAVSYDQLTGYGI